MNGEHVGPASAAAGNASEYDEGRSAGYGVGSDAASNDVCSSGYTDGPDHASADYWFYIDYGGSPDGAAGWISSRSDTALGALKAALDGAGVRYRISSCGIISDIGGITGTSPAVDPETAVLSGRGWYFWSWSTDTPCAGRWVRSEGYMNQTAGTFFYIAFADWEWDMISPGPVILTGPDAGTAWMDGGPFSA